jgi:hypothetical protein
MRWDSARRNEGSSRSIPRGAPRRSLAIAMRRVQRDACLDTRDINAPPFGLALHLPGSLQDAFRGKMDASTIFRAVGSKKRLASHALPFPVRLAALAFPPTCPPPQWWMRTRTTASRQTEARRWRGQRCVDLPLPSPPARPPASREGRSLPSAAREWEWEGDGGAARGKSSMLQASVGRGMCWAIRELALTDGGTLTAKRYARPVAATNRCHRPGLVPR